MLSVAHRLGVHKLKPSTDCVTVVPALSMLRDSNLAQLEIFWKCVRKCLKESESTREEFKMKPDFSC